MPSSRSGLSLVQSASLCAVALANLRGKTAPLPASGPAAVNASAPPRRAQGPCCYTDITVELQKKMDDERGVIVRAPDKGVDSAYKPASLWLKSIYPPNQMYIWNEDAHLAGLEGFQYWKAHLAYVVEDEHMDTVLGDTYYGHDANACDSWDSKTTRCYHEDDQDRWNCPGGYKYDNGNWEENSQAKGSGDFQCRGCHFANDDGTKDLDQDLNQEYVGSWNCNCPDGVNADEYVDRIIQKGYMTDSGWGADRNTCWVDDVSAMADIQNNLWWKWMAEKKVSAQQTTLDYWGWNEIAVKREIDDPANQYWKALLVFLPAGSKVSLNRLEKDDQWDFHEQLKEFKKDGWLVPGVANIGVRPGSYIVMAKEEDDESGSGNFMKHFFCEGWELDGSELKICFKNQDEAIKETGYCYVEFSNVACA